MKQRGLVMHEKLDKAAVSVRGRASNALQPAAHPAGCLTSSAEQGLQCRQVALRLRLTCPVATSTKRAATPAD
jgi:hypothetical protein